MRRVVLVMGDEEMSAYDCDDCKDTGIINDYCPHCNGSGEGHSDGSWCSGCKGSGMLPRLCDECAYADVEGIEV